MHMSDIIVRGTDPGADTITVDGTTYSADAAGQFSVPEEKLHRLLDMGVFRANALTGAQIAALDISGRIKPGDLFYNTSADKPLFKNGAGDGWVDGAGTVVDMDSPTVATVPADTQTVFDTGSLNVGFSKLMNHASITATSVKVYDVTAAAYITLGTITPNDSATTSVALRAAGNANWPLGHTLQVVVSAAALSANGVPCTAYTTPTGITVGSD
jgi:hypothetical protein